MSIERKSRIAEGRNALRALAPRWPSLARTRFEQGGFPRKNRLRNASAAKRYSRFQAAASVNGDNAWHLGKTLIAALRASPFRQMVRATSGERGRLARCVTRLAGHSKGAKIQP